MKFPFEVCCLVCDKVFCCADCRWRHEQITHKLPFNCALCHGNKFLCRPELLNQEFIKHLEENHLPLHCNKCEQLFTTMEDFTDIDKCSTVSELIDKDPTNNDSKIEDKFDSLYDKLENNNEDSEAIASVSKNSRTAIITPVMRKQYLVDYELSESETEDSPKVELTRTPHPKSVPKTPKLKQRAATPHVKKLLSLMRQKAVEEYADTGDGDGEDSESSVPLKTTPARNENCTELEPPKVMTTPTSHIPNLLKLVQTVTTSTPTHPETPGWSLFPDQGADSPLSEIENAESPAQNNPEDEQSKNFSENLAPKLKSIIVTGSRSKIGSQDSSEKQVTFQDSVNTEASSNSKIKKVKFAQDTVFEQETGLKRVYRKPKRMLTPGPQRPKFCYNPRFQALINRFENQGVSIARTPVNSARNKTLETPAAEVSNKPARAINFKDDSPVIEINHSKESNELFKTCMDTEDFQGESSSGFNTAISALSTNIVGSLQKCITNVLMTNEEETEIQFKFVITKKKLTVQRTFENSAGVKEDSAEVDTSNENKGNIWSSVARAVRGVFWSNKGHEYETPHRTHSSADSSSASKRKCDEMSDYNSPLNHKRYKYAGRIRGRPPLRRSNTWAVSDLKTTHSTEPLVDEAANQSF